MRLLHDDPQVLRHACSSLRTAGYASDMDAQGEVFLLLEDHGKSRLDQLRHDLHAIDPALDCTSALPSIEEVFAGKIRQRQTKREPST